MKIENYSFFGTCSNDIFHTTKVFENITKQTIQPKELILVDSGDKNKFKDLKLIIKSTKIDFVYIFEKLPRIQALNLAIDRVSTAYCFRFDTRTRFSKTYAEESLKLLLNKQNNLYFVGGSPEVIPEKETIRARICSQIISRPYVFFYPRHRRLEYSGESSSIYLGCFKTSILKKIKYKEVPYLISEDSLLSSDYKSKNYKLWLSSAIKLQYVARSSFLNTLRLFNTYGFCRFNTIIYSGKVHSKKRYTLILLFMSICFFSTLKISPLAIFLLPFILLIINIGGEIAHQKKKKNLLIPLLGSLCQISWLIGFIWAIFAYFKIKKSTSNFIK